MTIGDLKKVENKFTETLPAHICQYTNFFDFLKKLSSYILKSTEYAETILSLLDFTKSGGDMLTKVAKKVNVAYDSVYREADDEEYDKALKIGITGVMTKRLSDGTLYSLLKSIETNLSSDIIIRAIKDNQDMTVDLELEGSITDYNKDIIEDYIIPKVTGVFFDVSYIPYAKNIFAFNKNEMLIVDDTTGDYIKAVDDDGNEVDEYVLFKYIGNGNYEPITDDAGTYYYNGVKVKTAKTGFGGWDLGSWADKSHKN